MCSVSVPEMLHLKLETSLKASCLWIANFKPFSYESEPYSCVLSILEDFLPTLFDLNNPFNWKLEHCWNYFKSLASLRKNSVWPAFTVLYSSRLTPLFLCRCAWACVCVLGLYSRNSCSLTPSFNSLFSNWIKSFSSF